MKSPAPLPSVPLPQEGGSFIREADGSLRRAEVPVPVPPADPEPDPGEPTPPPEPEPASRRASKQPVKDA